MHSIIGSLTYGLVFNYVYNPQQLLKADLDFATFLKMSEKNLTSGKFEWYITGNLTPDEAISMTEKPEKVFKNIEGGKFQMLQHNNELVHIQPVDLEKNTTFNYVLHGHDKDNVNSCILSYFQKDEETMRSKLLNELIFQYLQEPAFNQLRTKEQLGYIASGFNVPTRLVNGGGFIIQSDAGSPEFLIHRIDSFLETQKQKIADLTDEEFSTNVTSIQSNKLQKDRNLRSETARLGYEIMTHQYEFDRKTKEIEMLSTLNKKEFINYFLSFFFDQPKRLNVHLLASQHLDNQQEFKKVNDEFSKANGVNNMYIDSIDAFKATADYFPDLYKINESFKAKM